MAEPYSTQFFLSHPPGGDGVVYVVPDGYVAVLRDLELWQPSAAGSGIYVGVQHASGTAQVVLIYVAAPAAAETARWTGDVVLGASDKIFLAGGSTDTGAVGSGYLLTVRT